MRPVIDFQHIFHGGDERRAGLGRNDELLFQVRFENVLFSVRPIVLSLTRSTIFSSTTLSSSRGKVHRARPFGGSEQLRAISFASPAPSKMRGLAEAASVCAPARPRSLLPPTAAASARCSQGRCSAPKRSGYHCRPPRLARRPPVTGCAPSSASAPGACRRGSSSPIVHPRPH